MIKFYMLPYAGNLANAYKDWKQFSDENIEFITIDYNGRGTRKHYPRPNNWQELIDGTFEQLKDSIVDSDYILFGHSMGAKVAYDLYYKIVQMNYPIPRYVFFASSSVKNYLQGDSINLSESEFEKYFIDMGGISEEVLKNEKLKTLVLKLLREDLLLLREFEYEKKPEVIRCPIVIMNGTQDPLCNISEEKEWNNILGKDYEYYEFEDGHFFIRSKKEEVYNLIKNILSL